MDPPPPPPTPPPTTPLLAPSPPEGGNKQGNISDISRAAAWFPICLQFVVSVLLWNIQKLLPSTV
ncbi:hypothetical protein EPI10_033138 [Gossypium australe]|uniref:Uncharacterized protein n=1 Tax=Gossypium australe TaxID=47621 RepID=A0A5B6X8I4_9ROSI|nr:hypothetical protein EPI10_033138 [Gossypium australe]